MFPCTAEPQFGGLKPYAELGFGGTFQRKRNIMRDIF
jgi:hypothetical protein